jgi:hypothetical protein
LLLSCLASAEPGRPLAPRLFFTGAEQRKDDQFDQQNARRREKDNLPLADALLLSYRKK